MRLRAVLIVFVLGAVGACGSDDDSPTDTSVRTTTTVILTTTTTAAAKLTTPELAAKHLYDSWKAGDKNRARLYATDEAVNTVFARNYTGPEAEFMGCEPAGSKFDCAYRYEGGSTHYTVEGSAAAGYKVTKVGSVAD